MYETKRVVNSLAVQQLGLSTLTVAVAQGSVPSWGSKIPQTAHPREEPCEREQDGSFFKKKSFNLLSGN